MNPNILLNEQNGNQLITACLLSLASNYQPDKHLGHLTQRFRQHLAVKQIWLSDIIINPDSSILADCPIYHNQMAFITLHHAIGYNKLHQITKHLENLAHRCDFDKPIVTLDVDIIAVQTRQIATQQIETQLNNWKALARRLPLASYEKSCLTNLLQKIPLSVIDFSSMTSAQSQQFFRWLLNDDIV